VRNGPSVNLVNCALGTSMFNIVWNTQVLQDSDLDSVAQNTIQEFKGQPFSWWTGPSGFSHSLKQKLFEYGVMEESNERAMACDLNCVPFQEIDQNFLDIEPIIHAEQLASFAQILAPYDKMAHGFYQTIPESDLQKSEKLFLGSVKNYPIVIGILFEWKETCGVYTLVTREDQRGRGYGTAMMKFLMAQAKQYGSRYLTLSASSDAGYRIYERLGFQYFGQLMCFEKKGRL
jgi:GNAT superfamily N-acetyltransferase